MNTDTVSERVLFTKPLEGSSQHFIKVFLKEGAGISDCLALSEELNLHPLVKETYIFLDGMLDVETRRTLQRLRLAQLNLEKRGCKTKWILSLLRRRKLDD